MNDLNFKIQMLIESTDYDDLSAVDREMVLAAVTEEAYRNRRGVLLESAKVFQEEEAYLTPDVASLSRLKRVNAEKTQWTVAWIESLIRIQVPAVQMSLVALAFMVLTYFYAKNDNVSTIEYVDREVGVYETITDTVIVEYIQEVLVERMARNTALTIRRNPSQESIATYADIVDIEGITSPSFPKISDIRNSFGNSQVDPDDLGQFRVSM